MYRTSVALMVFICTIGGFVHSGCAQNKSHQSTANTPEDTVLPPDSLLPLTVVASQDIGPLGNEGLSGIDSLTIFIEDALNECGTSENTNKEMYRIIKRYLRSNGVNVSGKLEDDPRTYENKPRTFFDLKNTPPTLVFKYTSNTSNIKLQGGEPNIECAYGSHMYVSTWSLTQKQDGVVYLVRSKVWEASPGYYIKTVNEKSFSGELKGLLRESLDDFLIEYHKVN